MAGLKGAIRYLMREVGTHQRNVPATDANGGPVANWVTQSSGIRFATWPIETNVATDYARRDISVTTAVCTDADLGAKPADRIVIGSVYYVVKGLEPYANTGLLSNPIYVMHCERRTV